MATQRNAPAPQDPKNNPPATSPQAPSQPREKPPAESPGDQPIDPVKALLASIGRLSPEDRARFEKVGVSLPEYLTDDTEGEARWGYRCRHCNQIALEFVGLRFRDSLGQEIDYVPPARPYDVPFRQPMLEARYVNRSHPVCQHCMRPVDLMHGALMSRRVVDIRPWVESRDRQVAIAKKEGRKRKMDLQEGDTVPGYDAQAEFAAAVPRDADGNVILDESARYSEQKRAALSKLSDQLGLGRIAFPESR